MSASRGSVVPSAAGLGAVVLLAGAESCLLFLLTAALAGGPVRAPAPWLWLWAVGLAAYVAPRLAPEWRVQIAIAGYLASIGVSLALAPGASAEPALLVVALLAIWWWQATRGGLGLRMVERTFRSAPIWVALLAVLGMFLWPRLGEGGAAAGAFLLHAAASLALAYGALLLARWAQTASPGGVSLGRSVWGGVAPVALALVAALALASVLFGRTELFAGAIAVIEGVLNAVLGGLVAFVRWLVELLFGGSTGASSPAPRTEPRDASEGPISAWAPPAWLVWLVRLSSAALVLFLLLRYTPIRRVSKRRARPRTGQDSVWSPGELRAELGAMVGRLGRRFRRRGADPLARLLRDPVWRHTAEVRRAYRDTERRFGGAGRARAPSATPDEHAHAQGEPDLEALAGVYDEARYGTHPLSPDAAERARALERELARRGVDVKRGDDVLRGHG